MRFIDNIKKKLIEEKFSLELLNYCKKIFQYGGFNEEDIAEFSILLSENIRNSLPNLTQQQINQILQVCIDRGIYDIKDLLFLDGTAFAVKYYDSSQETVDFICESKEYRVCDFLELTFFFTNERITKNDDSFLKSLRKELNEIFIKYYNITSFPEKLGINYAENQEFAIKCDTEEIINGINNNVSFPISIICNIKGTNEILLLKLTYNPNGEKLILINNVNNNVNKLSELLSKKDQVDNSSLLSGEDRMNFFPEKLTCNKTKKYLRSK